MLHLLSIIYFQSENILHVPTFKYHWLNCTAMFAPFACLLQGLSMKRPLVIGKDERGLYLLQISSPTALFLATVSSIILLLVNVLCPSENSVSNVDVSFLLLTLRVKDYTVWHHRWGHLHNRKLHTFSLCNMKANNNTDCFSFSWCLS